MTRRLIEDWLPIDALSEECVRERRSMSALPPTYYLHVWWARRPLVASRAAVLASLLPADAEHERFLHMLGIHGDPVAARRAIDGARRTGIRVEDPYGYPRAFSWLPNANDRRWFETNKQIKDAVVLDPTAGGGSIPFEATRLGLNTLANDLNPVASLILKATVEWPTKHGAELTTAFGKLAKTFLERLKPILHSYFPQRDAPDQIDLTYLWSRTITCPYCDGLVPLSPNWRLAPDGTGVRLHPDTAARRCRFEIVKGEQYQSDGTVKGGDAICPYPDCGRPIDGDEIKRQAQAGGMGEQLYTVVYKRKIEKLTKTGRKRESWERGYRAPRDEDDNSATIKQRIEEKLPEWEALDCVPNDSIPDGLKTREPLRYGFQLWRDLFSPRQLLGHGTAVEIFRDMVEERRAAGKLDEVTKATLVYLGLSLDKLRDYNSRMTRWHVNREVVVNTFDRHDFSFKWSYTEMAPLIEGLGYDWAVGQTAKSIKELVELVEPNSGLFADGRNAAPVTVSCKSADQLDHLDDASVDVVVMDPPYYDNVMYAELSDFFYVWLKRTAGLVVPELFTRRLTDKEQEAVANPAKFEGQKGAKARAYQDYRRRMEAIFAECSRVLKPDGVLTLMFTHKATGAWDALTKGLMEAGFVITASWPINTEAEGSLHIKDKSAANSTIFLVCRPRLARPGEVFWEDLEGEVRTAVRQRIGKFQAAGIKGVDLYLSAFGPALEVFSQHWPVRRGTAKIVSLASRRRQADLLEEEPDPYAASPEDALEAARREVKRWRMDQLTTIGRREELDPLTEWFVLAWDAFQAPQFAYDEALRLARATGVDLESEVVGRLARKKTSDLILLDSAARAAAHVLGPIRPDGWMIDAVHQVAARIRAANVDAGVQVLKQAGLLDSARFRKTLQAVLEVLPPSKAFTGFDPGKGALEDAASDFEALEKLRRLAFADQIPQPKQIEMFLQAAE